MEYKQLVTKEEKAEELANLLKKANNGQRIHVVGPKKPEERRLVDRVAKIVGTALLVLYIAAKTLPMSVLAPVAYGADVGQYYAQQEQSLQVKDEFLQNNLANTILKNELHINGSNAFVVSRTEQLDNPRHQNFLFGNQVGQGQRRDNFGEIVPDAASKYTVDVAYVSPNFQNVQYQRVGVSEQLFEKLCVSPSAPETVRNSIYQNKETITTYSITQNCETPAGVDLSNPAHFYGGNDAMLKISYPNQIDQEFRLVTSPTEVTVLSQARREKTDTGYQTVVVQEEGTKLDDSLDLAPGEFYESAMMSAKGLKEKRTLKEQFASTMREVYSDGKFSYK